MLMSKNSTKENRLLRMIKLDPKTAKKHHSKFGSIRINLIVFSLTIILLMTILSIYSLSVLNRYKGQIETMFDKHIELSEFHGLIQEMDDDLLGFLTTKSSTKLNDFNKNSQELSRLMDVQEDELFTMDEVLMKNIRNLTSAYQEAAQEAISYKRQRNVSSYYSAYEQSEKIKSFIFEYIDELNEIQLTRNSLAYVELVNEIRLLQNITYFIVISLIVVSLLIVYLITDRMVKPFGLLSHAAEEIAEGNFEVKDIELQTDDEFKLLAIAFNKMKASIRDYVNELNARAETEAKLKDEQMKNIKMEHLLDNARLYALQSQINPHFLFNTINAGVQMSIMERATRTGQFLESMSRLFRYNIQKIDSISTLGEEIKNITDYYDLLKVRFGQRILFELDIEPLTLDVKIPPLILQPLVENAYIHGLSGLEQGGTIRVKTKYLADYVVVTVEDDGRGMDEASIKAILSHQDTRLDERSADESPGIGVRNVRDRLELFCHSNKVFRMEGDKGKGVRVIMYIPHEV